MKTAVLQIVVSLFFTSLTMATSVKGQELLDTRVSINLTNVKLSNVLVELEKTTHVKFSYNSRTLKLGKKVSLNVENEALASVLTKLLTPINISFIQVSNRIVLHQENDKKVGLSQSEQTTSSPFINAVSETLIKGVVLDENKEKLVGVSVAVKGTTRGSITDVNGEFTIKVPDTKSILVFSFLGYQNQEISVGNQTNFIINLIPDLKALDEVVVVGYGTSTQRNLTTAVVRVKAEDINVSSSPNLQQALQGKVAGVEVIQSTGQPGASATVKIRSNPSNASAGVLYVVDGVPFNDLSTNANGTAAALSAAGPYGTGGVSQSPLNAINPNDIESIDFLKDASATAIYGARAGAGVVLITTKRGATGAPRINYSIDYTNQQVADMFSVLGAKDYMITKNQLTEEKWYMDNKVAPYYGNVEKSAVTKPILYPYTQAQIDQTVNGKTAMEAITRPGYSVQNNISISGGTEKTRYFISGNVFNQKGVIIGTDFNRYTGRLNLNQEISRKLHAGVNVMIANFSNNATVTGGQNEYGGIVTAAVYYPGNMALRDADGGYPVNPFYANIPNPLSYETNTDITSNLRVFTSGNLKWDILPALTAQMNVSHDVLNTKRNVYFPTTFLKGSASKGEATIANQQTQNQLLEFVLSYKKDFRKNSFSAVGGYSYNFGSINSVSVSNKQFFSDAQKYYNIGGGAGVPSVSSGQSEKTWASYFGRVTYTYDNTYILQASLRADGASNFADNKKWGYFPSVSASWVLSNQEFIKAIDFINYAKVRIGYGQSGNSNFPGSAFQSYGTGLSAYLGTGSINPGINITQAANPNLTWETASELNFGLDFGVLKNRLTGSVDVYNKSINGLIIFQPYSSDFIIPGVYTNSGITKSEGWELMLNSKNLVASSTNQLGWSTTLTLSHYLNYWQQRDDLALKNLPPYIPVSGKDALFNPYVGYLSDGLFKGQFGTAPGWMPGLLPGVAILRDIDGFDANGKLTGQPDGKITAADQRIQGNRDPQLSIGFNNTFTYKNFSLSINLAGIKQLKPSGLVSYIGMLGGDGILNFGWNRATAINDRWSVLNPAGTLPTSLGDTKYGSLGSDYWLQDASFIRCRNLALSYNIPSSWIKTQKAISGVRLTVQAQNLFTITKFTGMDPELDATNYFPFTRSYGIGLNVTF
ncbi:MAG: TonB-dependent receptor [Arcicella sp.]|nr:TonB-dependent receptor [Arcicella sp.]